LVSWLAKWSGGTLVAEVQSKRSATSSDSAERPFLVIEGLRKVYGGVTAADITRLEARRGELLTLLGPSGCGKTTTLRCIAGLVQADAGAIVVDGRDITALPTHKRNLGMVFQNYAIFPHMTVFDNVAYGLRGRGLSKAAIGERVAEALHLVELTGYEARYRHQLSGGQQQRVALARAVAYEPDVLLLDEPFSNLDAKLRKSMRLQVRKLQQRLALTTVFVTHDQQEALSLSDVVAVINEGKLEQVGTPNEVYQRPASEFVADFIGSTNLIPGTVRGVDADGHTIEVLVEGNASLRIWHERALAAGSRVKVLCKPEDARVVAEGPLRGQLSAVGYLGSVVQYQVELGECSLEVIVPAEANVRLDPGADVCLDLRTEHLRLIEA
jgi:ABC-type Fe3+/spermidine/putrescine transport system ATPase subunit